MIKIAALTAGLNVPSARFRIRQHIEPLRELGVHVREYRSPIERGQRPPAFLGGGRDPLPLPLRGGFLGAQIMARLPGVAASHAADGTWLNKELVAGYATLERLARSPVFLDVDDALWLGRPSIRRVAEAVDVVIAGNAYIAEWFASYCDRVEIVPTAVDTERFHPAAAGEAVADAGFVIGWTGSADNLQYLESLEDVLGPFLARNRDATLRVICDRAPKFRSIAGDRIEFMRWSPDVETVALQGLGAGLMPLPDSPWARGKCSFKMLQYMSAGVPVVVSPVGMNREVLEQGEVGFAARSPGEWTSALQALYEDVGLRRRLGRTARAVVEREYSVSAVAPRLAEIFRRHIG